MNTCTITTIIYVIVVLCVHIYIYIYMLLFTYIHTYCGVRDRCRSIYDGDVYGVTNSCIMYVPCVMHVHCIRIVDGVGCSKRSERMSKYEHIRNATT